MVVRIAGKHMYLWRAVGHEGEILDMAGAAPSALRCGIADSVVTMRGASERAIVSRGGGTGEVLRLGRLRSPNWWCHHSRPCAIGDGPGRW